MQMQRIFALFLLALPIHPAQAEEDWIARFQTTYIWQHKPGFNAAYSGPNSLSPNAEDSYTFTTDSFIGVRARQDTEL